MADAPRRRPPRRARPALPAEYGTPTLPDLDIWGLPRGTHGIDPGTIVASQRARMLYAMVQAVAQQGYTATSVADVVRIAGVSRVTFYAQFEDKEDCFIAAYEAHHYALAKAVVTAQREGDDWATRLSDSVAAYLAYCRDNPDMLRALLVQIHAAGVRAWEKREWGHARFAQMQKQLYALRGREMSQQAELPDEIFRGAIAAVEEMVNVYQQRGWSTRLMELHPKVLQLLHLLYGGVPSRSRKRAAPPP